MELTRLIQRIETALLYYLARQLVRGLVIPLVDQWDIQLVDEDDTLASVRRTVNQPLALVYETLYVHLQDTCCCSATEVDVADAIILAVGTVLALQVREDVLRLPRACLTSE